MPPASIDITGEFEEPDDPLDGVIHRLIISAAAIAVTFGLYILFCVIGKKRGWFTKGKNPDALSKDDKKAASYVYRERTSDVVRESRPADTSATNVYKNDQL